jgi:hypothetical protein
MATTTFLGNATVNITQGMTSWDVSDQCTACTVTVGQESLDATAFSSASPAGRSFVGGLQSVEVTMTLFLSYGASEVEAMIAAIVGQGSTTLVISPSGTSEGPANPEYTITGTMCESAPVISSSVGELAQVDLTFTGGTWVRDVTP